jgi:hypothetical protein
MKKSIAGSVVVVPVLFFAAFAGPQLTFLDTLNKGREISVTDADVAPQQVPAAVARQASPDSPASAGTSEPNREAGVVPSRFKIQILASTQEQMVRKEKNALAAKIALPLVIIFESHYYKLFAGDFARHDEAESYCSQLKKLGYSDVWIVRTAASRQ